MKLGINIALSPNSTKDDIKMAFSYLFAPWKWKFYKYGDDVGRLENAFCQFFNMKYAFAMGSGRESLFLILKSLGLQNNDEVILQSFTCMVVVNSITWNGLKPIYVDINKKTYNLDASKLEQSITSKTKVVIIQHTFGIAAEVEKIKEICNKHNLILIEDCAHAMGAKHNTQNKLLGTYGDVAFFSLGRSKVISCVNGGIIVTNNDKIGGLIKKNVQKLKISKITTIIRNLLHPIIFEIVKFSYNFISLGKVIIVASQKLKLLTFEVTQSEKKGIYKTPYPTKLPNALASIGLIQFGRLNEFNSIRKKISQKYYDSLKEIDYISAPDPSKLNGAIFLRYPIQVKDSKKRAEIIALARSNNIILGDWYASPIAPPSVDSTKTQYAKGSNQATEQVCSTVINLPTHHGISHENIKDILALFR